MGLRRLMWPLYVTVVASALAAAVACSNPTPSPQPTSTSTPTLEATITAVPTPTRRPEPSPTGTQQYGTATPTATAYATASATSTPSPTPLPTFTPQPTPTATATVVPPTPTFTRTPTPTATPKPTATATPTATPTPTSTPTATPTPTPTPTPLPNPAVVYATNLGLSQPVVNSLAGLGLDGILDSTEKAFVDAVAANPLEVQLAMVKSTYVVNKTLPLTDLVEAATTMQTKKYHSELKKAVWNMPDETVQLESSESYSLGSIIKSVAAKEAKAIASLGALNTFLADSSPFWKTFSEKGDVVDWGTVVDGGKIVVGAYPSGYVYRTTFVPFDAKKWSGREATKNSWSAAVAMVNLMIGKGEVPSNDLDAVLDALGVYPGQCFYCNGKTWDLLEVYGKGDKGNNGYIAYFNMVGSEGNIVREWLKTISDLVWKDSQGMLVRPLSANSQDELWMFLSRDPVVNGGSTTAFASLNVSYMDKTKRPDGTYSSTYAWAKSIVGDTKDERTAVRRIMDWYFGNVTHRSRATYPSSATTRDYQGVSPQNPEIPPAWAIPLVKLTSSGLNITGITASLKSLGIPAEGIIIDEGNNIGMVDVNGQKWYYEGDSIFNASRRGITSCNVFGTYEQVKTLPTRLGDGSFCN